MGFVGGLNEVILCVEGVLSWDKGGMRWLTQSCDWMASLWTVSYWSLTRARLIYM